MRKVGQATSVQISNVKSVIGREAAFNFTLWEVGKEDVVTFAVRKAGGLRYGAVFPDGEHGKHAVTHYKVLRNFSYISLIECKLETGRTHQIRAHLKYAGHPLFNDERYGGSKILRGTTSGAYRKFVGDCFALLPRQALHAKSLGFLHPITRKPMYFDSELPADMTAVIDKWEALFSELKDRT